MLNDWQLPSTVEFLRLVGPNSSRTIDIDVSITVWTSLNQTILPGDLIEEIAAS
jgi:hypothetical protein